MHATICNVDSTGSLSIESTKSMIDVLIDIFSGFEYFTTYYLKPHYHHIRIGEENDWKTTFKTMDGL
jgi:hypothetical protein